MVTGMVRVQLVVFACLTLAAALLITFVYVRVPALVGVGRIDLVGQFSSSGGVYPNANVTYRGVTVGRVTGVTLAPHGVDVAMSVDEGVPASSRAEVHSVSAIGEQYVDLVPADGEPATAFTDGAVIPVARTSVPVRIADVLQSVDTTLASVNDQQLATVLDEFAAGFRDLGPELGALLDDTRALVATADASHPETSALLRDLDPFLDTQQAIGPDLRAWTADLASFSDAVRAGDGDLRGVLRHTPGTARRVGDLVEQIAPATASLLDHTGTLTRLARAYNVPLEQVFVVYPLFVVAELSSVPENRPDSLGFDLKIVTNQPQCDVGWAQPGEPGGPRNAFELEDIALPDGTYCQIPQDDPRLTRGARNLPCFEPGSPPDRRAATVQQCRGEGYDPTGTVNPTWEIGGGLGEFAFPSGPPAATPAAPDPLAAFGGVSTPSRPQEDMTVQNLILGGTTP